MSSKFILEPIVKKILFLINGISDKLFNKLGRELF
jgi:hypothetical protein